jgi:glycosyltransferase involved in cell wall biosynthesis
VRKKAIRSESRIAIIVPIYHREEDTMKCLESFKSMDHGGKEIFIYFVVNGASESFLEKIKSISDEINRVTHPSIISYVKEPGDNLGKPVAVNIYAKEAISTKDVGYIVSMDSDMVPLDDRWVTRLSFEWYLLSIRSDFRVGAICGNQSGNNCHVPLEPKTIDIEYQGSSFIIAKGNNGIAGGVLFTSSYDWETVNGYNAHRIYGSDDGHFCLAKEKEGKKVVLSINTTFFHPFPDDDGYSNWKKRAIEDNLKDEEKGGYYVL